MTDHRHEPWPFAPSLRLSAMALLAVVLSTFVDGFVCVALLAAAATLTTMSVLRFVKTLRKERAALAVEAPPGSDEPATRERV